MSSATREQIRAIWQKKTKNIWVAGPKFLDGADKTYWLPDADQIAAMLDKAPVGHMGQLGDMFDCDDYCVVLKARMSYVAVKFQNTFDRLPISLGVVWCRCSWMPDPAHAANWVITSGGDIVLIEPQYNNAEAKQNGFHPIRGDQSLVSHIQLVIF
jgi:hypothetical protein